MCYKMLVGGSFEEHIVSHTHFIVLILRNVIRSDFAKCQSHSSKSAILVWLYSSTEKCQLKAQDINKVIYFKPKGGETNRKYISH